MHQIFVVCLWRTNCKCIKIKTSKERHVSTWKSRICLRKKQSFLWWLLKQLRSEWCWEIILCFLVADSQIWLRLLCNPCSLRCFQVVFNCEIAANVVWRQYIAHDFSTHFHASSSIVNYSGNLNFKEDRETCISLLLSILEPFLAEVSQNHASLTLSVRTVEKEVWN